jgi:hypothetical protein
MHTLTTLQALKIIDQSAIEDRLYHHNGGQAYIRLSLNPDVLMIIDHSLAGKPEVSLHDGREYFKAYAGANIEHSKRLREHGSLADWYEEHYGAEEVLV